MNTTPHWDRRLSQEEIDSIMDNLVDGFSDDFDDSMAVVMLDVLGSDFIAMHNAITKHGSPIPTAWRK